MDLSHLNPPQAEAVRTTEGPLLVLAGAGSGKTRVIAHRVAYLLHKKRVAPERILAVTFTNKAAAEMRERIALLSEKLGARRAPQGLTVTTFHAFGAEVLRQDGERLGLPGGFAIADAGDQLSLVKRALREVRVDDRAFDARRVLALLSRAKCTGKPPEPRPEGLGDDYDLIASLVYPRYGLALRAQGMVDFDDLIVLPAQLLREHPDVRGRYRARFQYVLVDEYQDTSRSQFELLELLAGERPNLCVVGDDDQSIYGWRGAEVGNILGFHLAFPGAREVYLEQNYRSTGSILGAANAVIAKNAARKPKRLWCDRGSGEPVRDVACPDDDEEARFIALELESLLRAGRRPSELAVLYRTSAQSRPIEEALRAVGISYDVTGGPEFFDRREVKDLVAYLKACVNPRDEVALLRIVNVPARGIGDATMERIARGAAESEVGLWEAMQKAESQSDLPAGAGARVAAFCQIIARYRERFGGGALDRVVRELVEEIGLRDEIKRQTPSLEAASRRIAALEQLIDSVAAHARAGRGDLAAYLRLLALDNREEEAGEGGERVVLSTLHAAKGLEWPVVVLCGMEEELLPHRGMQGEPQNLEEERRLAYVGITRARERLYLTHATARRFRGKLVPRTPSRFLQDIPSDLLASTDLSKPPPDASPTREQDFLAQLRERLKGQGAG